MCNKKLDYIFSNDDLLKTFEFAVKYHLDESKPHVGRTNSEPIGLGGHLDAFIRGKLVEIATVKIIERLNNQLKCELDFELHSASAVRTDPDIISVNQSNIDRAPNIFIEVKNTQENDNFIGPTKEQFDSMLEGASGRKIFIIYLSIDFSGESSKKRKNDLLGVFLKKNMSKNSNTNLLMNDFNDIMPRAVVEYIISNSDLKNFSTSFPSQGLMLDPDIFVEKNIFKKDGSLKHNAGSLIDSKNNFQGNISLLLDSNKGPESDPLFFKGQKYEPFCNFKINGSFNIYHKENNKSIRRYIHCVSDVLLSSDVWGTICLKKGKSYTFYLTTAGRNPINKRDNLFISKNRYKELVELNKIKSVQKVFEDISKEI